MDHTIWVAIIGAIAAVAVAFIQNLKYLLRKKRPEGSATQTVSESAILPADATADMVAGNGQLYGRIFWRSITSFAAVLAITAIIAAVVAAKDRSAARDIAAVNNALPVGSVVAFWGSVDKIPENYELCDGRPVHTQGSPLVGSLKPDMKDRFIMGVTTQSDVITVPVQGGRNQIPDYVQGSTLGHSLTIEEMPAHDHGGKTGDNAGQIRITADGLLAKTTGQFGARDHGGATPDLLDIRAAQTLAPVLPDHHHSIVTQGGGKEHVHPLPTIPGYDSRPLYQGMLYILRVK